VKASGDDYRVGPRSPLLSSPGDRPPSALRARRVPNRSAPGVLRPVLARLVWRLLRECAAAVSLGRESGRAAHARYAALVLANLMNSRLHTGYSTDPRWYSHCRHARERVFRRVVRFSAFEASFQREALSLLRVTLFSLAGRRYSETSAQGSSRTLAFFLPSFSSSREGDERYAWTDVASSASIPDSRRESLRSRSRERSDHAAISANLDPADERL